MLLGFLVYIGFILSFGGILCTLILCTVIENSNKWIMISTFITLIGIVFFFGGMALSGT